MGTETELLHDPRNAGKEHAGDGVPGLVGRARVRGGPRRRAPDEFRKPTPTDFAGENDCAVCLDLLPSQSDRPQQ